MIETTVSLSKFQITYLLNLVKNIPEDLLYSKQLDGFSSPGWLLGHIVVEAEDVFDYLKIEYTPVPSTWHNWFVNTTGRITELKGLPSKAQLIKHLEERYSLMQTTYLQLEENERLAKSPSEMLGALLPTVDTWIAHHLSTHISIHCGNITVWKKLHGLEIGGY